MRCREVKRRAIRPEDVSLQVTTYDTDLTREHFLEYQTNENSGEPGLLAAFLRLSLPLRPNVGSRAFLPEIADSAMIREVHVYGPALGIGVESEGEAQHRGLGGRLLDQARNISQAAGFQRLSVIAATGTRDYYAARGFQAGELYMTCHLA
jgi:elongator complex protein 3